MSIAWRMAVIIFAGLSFIFFHEMGHWIIAEAFSLDPGFVLGGANNGILGLAIGVMHNPATQIQEAMVILGATFLPLLIAIIAAGTAYLTGSEMATLIAEVYLLLIVVNLIPIPGIDQLDANRLLAAILPP